jgi:hypothetical protein
MGLNAHTHKGTPTESEDAYKRSLRARGCQRRPCSKAKRVAAVRELTPSLW